MKVKTESEHQKPHSLDEFDKLLHDIAVVPKSTVETERTKQQHQRQERRENKQTVKSK